MQLDPLKKLIFIYDKLFYNVYDNYCKHRAVICFLKSSIYICYGRVPLLIYLGHTSLDVIWASEGVL